MKSRTRRRKKKRRKKINLIWKMISRERLKD